MRLQLGQLSLPTNLLLAPVAGYCDLPFRRVVRSVPGVPCPPEMVGGIHDIGDGTYGAVSLCCTDLLCPQAVLRETDTSQWLAATHPDDRPLAMQLYGSDPGIMADAARWAQDRGASLIDINMGCPVDKVTKTFAGSKLLCDPDHAVSLTRSVVQAVDLPVTVKIRLGWDDQSIIADTLPARFADVGAVAITVHGRTTEQRFKPSARLEGIARVVRCVKQHHPNVAVIGNGDITEPQHARQMLDHTGCDGVMIARGALGNPWIFRDTAYLLATGLSASPIPQVDKARLVLDHFEHLMHHRGEKYAMHQIRFRIAKYSAHLQPWPHLRRKVRGMRDAQVFRDYWHEAMASLAPLEPAA